MEHISSLANSAAQEKIHICYLFALASSMSEKSKNFYNNFIVPVYLLDKLDQKAEIVNRIAEFLKSNYEGKIPRYIEEKFGGQHPAATKAVWQKIGHIAALGRNDYFPRGEVDKLIAAEVDKTLSRGGRIIELVDHIFNSKIIDIGRFNKDKCHIYSLTYNIDKEWAKGSLLDFNVLNDGNVLDGDLVFIGGIRIGIFRNIYFSKIIKAIAEGKKKITAVGLMTGVGDVFEPYIKFLTYNKIINMKSWAYTADNENAKKLEEFNWMNESVSSYKRQNNYNLYIIEKSAAFIKN